jgi:cystathionine beta-lyase/cystathionine gamma-synthase
MYASVPAASRIGDSVIRSIGFEDAGELIADLDQFLAKIL